MLPHSPRQKTAASLSQQQKRDLTALAKPKNKTMGDAWAAKMTRRILVFLYQVDRATETQIVDHFGHPRTTVAAGIQKLFKQGLVEKDGSDYRLSSERIHAWHKMEMAFFWGGVPNFESYFLSEAPSIPERGALGDLLVGRWDAVASSLDSREKKMLVGVLLAGPRTFAEMKDVLGMTTATFRQVALGMVESGLIGSSGPRGHKIYHLNHGVLAQYHRERQQFLWRMRVPITPSVGVLDGLTAEERKRVGRLLEEPGHPIDDAWAGRSTRSVLIALYMSSRPLTVTKVWQETRVSNTKELLTRLVDEGLVEVRTVKGVDAYSIVAPALHQRRQADLEFFWNDASGLDAAFAQAPVAHTTSEGYKKRWADDWHETIEALNLSVARAMVRLLQPRGPVTLSGLARLTGLPPEELEKGYIALLGAGLVASEEAGDDKLLHLNTERLFQYTHEVYRLMWRTTKLLEFERRNEALGRAENPSQVSQSPSLGAKTELYADSSEAPKKGAGSLQGELGAKPADGVVGHAADRLLSLQMEPVWALLARNSTAEWWFGVRARRVILSLYRQGALSPQALKESLGLGQDAFSAVREVAFTVKVNGSPSTLLVPDVAYFHQYGYEELQLFWGADTDLGSLFGESPSAPQAAVVLSERLAHAWKSVAQALASDARRAMLYVLKVAGPMTKGKLKEATIAEGFDREFRYLLAANLVTQTGSSRPPEWGLNETVLKAYHKDLYQFMSRPYIPSSQRPTLDPTGPTVLAKEPTHRNQLTSGDRQFLDAKLKTIGASSSQAKPRWMRDPVQRTMAIWAYHFGTSKQGDYNIPGQPEGTIAGRLHGLVKEGVASSQSVEGVVRYTIIPQKLNTPHANEVDFFWHDYPGIEQAWGPTFTDRRERELNAWRLSGYWNEVMVALSQPLEQVSVYILQRYGARTPTELADWIGVSVEEVEEAMRVLSKAELVHPSSAVAGAYEADLDRLFRYHRDWHQFLFRDPSIRGTMPEVPVKTLEVSLEDQAVIAALLKEDPLAVHWQTQGRRQVLLFLYGAGSKHRSELHSEISFYERTVSKWIAELEGHGLVSVVRKPGTSSIISSTADRALQEVYLREIELFFGDRSSRPASFDTPVTSTERAQLLEKLVGQWTPVATTLTSGVAKAMLYLVRQYGALSSQQLEDIFEEGQTPPRSALRSLENTGLLEKRVRGRTATYHLGSTSLEDYHRDLFRFLTSDSPGRP